MPAFFTANFWGGEEPNFRDIYAQVRSTMLLTVFVFVDMEGERLIALRQESQRRRGRHRPRISRRALTARYGGDYPIF